MLSTFAFGEAPFCVDDASISVVQNVDGTAAISFGASATASKAISVIWRSVSDGDDDFCV